jgi:hypothetical protein
MTYETIFSIASGIAFLGWLALITLPRPWRFRLPILICAPALALAYAWLIIPSLSELDFMAFSTLAGVMSLQGTAEFALIGWLHYLAFDLLVGWIIANDAESKGLNRWAVVPSLILTFMLGPVGWLSYLLLRSFTGKGVTVRWQ